MKIALEPGAYPLTRAHPDDAGLDIRSPYNQVVPARGSAVFHTGVHVEIPEGCCGKIESKSGLNVRSDIITTGVVDRGFSGSILVKLYNLGTKEYRVSAGEKIAQLVLERISTDDVEIVPEIKGGERGLGGFGSTGKY